MIIDDIKLRHEMPPCIPRHEASHSGTGGFDTTDIVRSESFGFVYIPYEPNAINRCKLVTINCDVISCRFSGCLLAIWQERDGTIYAGHICTTLGSDCRSFWNSEIQRGNILWHYEFSPFDYHAVPPAGINYFDTYGLFTFGNDLRTIKPCAITTVNYDNQRRNYVYCKKFLPSVQF